MGWGWEEGCRRERKSGEEEARMNLWADTFTENSIKINVNAMQYNLFLLNNEGDVCQYVALP